MTIESTEVQNKFNVNSIFGLSNLLFPRKDLGENGFFIPKRIANTSVPKIVLIKGAPGSGKSTLTAQLLFESIRDGFKTVYLFTHSDNNYLQNTYDKFKLSQYGDPENIRKNIRKYPIDHTNFKPEKAKTPFWEAMNQFVFGPEETSEKIKEITNLLNDNEILFIDSMNLNDHPDRGLVRGFFTELLKFNLLSFICVEDYNDQGTAVIRQLIADCDFKADVIIDLGEEDRSGYAVRSIKVPKMRFSPQMYGKHLMKICSPWHSLYNITNNTGIVVYHSLTNHLSESRVDTFLLSKEEFVNTGITHLDSILIPHQSSKEIEGKSIPPNSSIVIQGNRGGYILPIGLNIVLGGMWKYNTHNQNISLGDDVLAIMLNEDTNIDLNEMPLPFRTELLTNKKCKRSLDNGNRIKWRHHIGIIREGMIKEIRSGLWEYLNAEQYLDEYGNVKKNIEDNSFKGEFKGLEAKVTKCFEECYHGKGHKGRSGDNDYHMQCNLAELFNPGNNFNQKVIINKWCGYIINELDKPIGCKKLVIANFRPGNITPEEFVSVVKILIDRGHFRRVLFYSTAQIPMRFPQLANDKLFLPVLIDVFKANNVVSVFIDPSGEGRDQNVSFGLSNMADYEIVIQDETGEGVVNLSGKPYELPKNMSEKLKKEFEEDIDKNIDECSWATMFVHNIRGQSYAKVHHSVTVRPRIIQKITECELETWLKISNSIAQELCKELKKIKLFTDKGEIILSKNNDTGSEDYKYNKLLKRLKSISDFLESNKIDCKELANLLYTILSKKRVGTELFLFNRQNMKKDGKKKLTANVAHYFEKDKAINK